MKIALYNPIIFCVKYEFSVYYVELCGIMAAMAALHIRTRIICEISTYLGSYAILSGKLHKNLLKDFSSAMVTEDQALLRSGCQLKLFRVPGHKGVLDNEYANRLVSLQHQALD